jgi:hypothetical protein
VSIGTILSQCSNDDFDNKIPIFPEFQMSLINGESEKSEKFKLLLFPIYCSLAGQSALNPLIYF